MKKLITYAVLSFIVLAGTTGAALAEPHGYNGRNNHGKNMRNYNHNRQWQERENRSRGYWRNNHYYVQPNVVYAPPVYYYPEPQYQSPGLNFIFPLHIR